MSRRVELRDQFVAHVSDKKQEQAHIGSDIGDKKQEQAHTGRDKRQSKSKSKCKLMLAVTSGRLMDEHASKQDKLLV